MRFQRFHFEEKESIITFLCSKRHLDSGRRAVSDARARLESYIQRHPDFGSALHPIRPEGDAPAIVLEMCRAAWKTGVGPMAAVAGAMAATALEAVLGAGANEAVIDNGGDIACRLERPLLAGIYPGDSSRAGIALELQPSPQIQAVCTSSGTVGPSLSFGRCDAAVVLSEDVALADAAATALGNRIASQDDLTTAFHAFDTLPRIRGAVAVCSDRIAFWGDLPPLRRAPIDPELITRGRIP